MRNVKNIRSYIHDWASESRRDRIVVSTLRCGSNNPGSNPGDGILLRVYFTSCPRCCPYIGFPAKCSIEMPPYHPVFFVEKKKTLKLGLQSIFLWSTQISFRDLWSRIFSGILKTCLYSISEGALGFHPKTSRFAVYSIQFNLIQFNLVYALYPLKYV